jgi:adenylate kinase
MKGSLPEPAAFVGEGAVFEQGAGRLLNRLCLILFGPPGSGKGTQARLLRQSLGVAHVSTGDMLRERVAAGDALGREVAGTMRSGGLVPDETVNRMVAERIEQPDCAAGFILDGYPRTVNQARLVTRLLAVKRIAPVVVYLKVDYNIIIARLSGRLQCPVCGALYSLPNVPGVPGVCGTDGSNLVAREDDRPEVVGERLKAYERQTTPVLEFLRGAGYSVAEIDGAAGPPPEIALQIQRLICSKDGAGA